MISANVIKLGNVSAAGSLGKKISFEDIVLSDNESDYVHHVNAENVAKALRDGTIQSLINTYDNITAPYTNFPGCFKALLAPIDVITPYNNGAKYLFVHGNLWSIYQKSDPNYKRYHATKAPHTICFVKIEDGAYTIIESDNTTENNHEFSYGAKIVKVHSMAVDVGMPSTTRGNNVEILDFVYDLNYLVHEKGATHMVVSWCYTEGPYRRSTSPIDDRYFTDAVIDKPTMYFIYETEE